MLSIRDRDPDELGAILRGGADKLIEAGVALAGGHSVEDDEPKFGLSVTGIVHPDHITTNAGAQPGDVIVLTKPLGTGIVTTAAKFDECAPETLRQTVVSMAMLNAGAARAMQTIGVGPDLPIHAATDITGFGLLGHLWQLARASGVGLELYADNLPLLPDLEALIAAGNVTRGDRENRDYLGESLRVESQVPNWRLSAMLDPQTSGGLAICVREADAARLQDELARNETLSQAIVGRVIGADGPTVHVV